MSFAHINRFLLLGASSTACIAALAAPAHAQEVHDVSGASVLTSGSGATSQASAPIMVEDSNRIVIRDDLSPDEGPPTGALDNVVDITGVGQMATRPDQNSFGLGLCTGTLINPRTVLFAAHCVNDQPAESYGFAQGGTAISFGFSADNLPGIRRWVGLDGGTANATDEEFAIYNVEHVWYDERSIPTSFLEADVAIATLDTHAGNIPTWTLLFSPLEEETHVTINGYGSRGIGSEGPIGIDFRRRIAENVLSSLSSLNDRNEFLFGPGDYGLPQSLYNLDFDSPAGEGVFDPNNGLFDFDLFDGPALPREGTTAGGDSGGPLIVDEKYDTPVVAGVLSGGSRFFGNDPNDPNTFQPFSSYGTQSFYQPLFLFWESIVANNNYVYASARAGNRNWENPNHWVQDLDPAYAIDVDGELVNALPGFAEPGVTGDTPKFGNVCFLDDCLDLSGASVPLDEGEPNSIFVEGGPGSTGFVPNNRPAAATNELGPRYYEVTLDAPGQTRLTTNITIDRLNIDGFATLNIRRSGSLKVWGDYTQTGGWLRVNGTLTTGEAFLGAGLITGKGTFDPTFLTSVQGTIAPGGLFGNTGTLTVAGDVILSSGSLTFFDVGRRRSDQLAIIGDADNPGIISLGGTAAVINKFGRRGARFGQRIEIITAEGGVQNQFDNVVGRIGVLYPELEYNPNSVVARMRAIRFSDFFRGSGITNPFSLAFGSALDLARSNSYTNLADVYGLIDVMEAPQLNATFQSLSAAQAGRTTTLDQQQGAAMRSLVADRLSLMGTARSGAGKFQIIGSSRTIGGDSGLNETAAAQISFAANYQSSEWNAVQLPENMSGFMSSGYDRSSLAFSDPGTGAEQGSWHIAMGLEYALDGSASLGTAFGYARGTQEVSGTLASVETNQASVYGNYLLGNNFYVGGQANVTHSRIDSSSRVTGVASTGDLNTSSVGFAGEIEAGYNVDVDGMTLTPRAAIGYSSYQVDGFRSSGGSLAMAVDEISRAGVDARIGLKLSGSSQVSFASSWSFQPEMKLDYVNRLSGNDTNFLLRFLEAENVPFALPIGLQDASYGEIKGGFSLTNGAMRFGAAVETRLGQQVYRDDRAVVNMSMRF